jgi:hypothetical protein
MPTAFYSILFSVSTNIPSLWDEEKLIPDRDKIFIDILLKTVKKIPLGMIYNILICSNIITTEPIFNEKYNY